jgi:ligand-binding sensor domain-containing protein/signal transduction histidine kinase
MKLLVLFLIIVLHTYKSNAQYFDQLTTYQGLSQSGVNSLLTDEKGFLWIGTQNGLNRYDGQRIKQYKTNPFDSLSLSYDDITCLALASNGLMLVGSRNGLNIYNSATDNFEQLFFEAKDGEKVSQIITGVCVYKSQFMVSTMSGLYKIQRNKDGWIKQRLYQKSVLDVQVFQNGNFIASTFNSLLSGNFNRNFIKNDTLVEIEFSIKSRSIYKQFFRKKEELCFVNGKNLLVVDQYLKIKKEPVELPNGTSYIMFDKSNRLWVGTENKGVFRYKFESNKYTLVDSLQEDLKVSYGLKSNYISYLYQEPDANADVVMLGTRDAGLYFFSAYKNNFRHYESMLLQNNPASAASVFSIFQEGDHYLWASTYNGLSRINLKDKTVKNFFVSGNKPSQLFQHIFQDSKGNIWFGGEQGLFLYNSNKETFTHIPIKGANNPNAEIVRITEDGNGDIVVAAIGYIAFLKNNTFKVITDAVINNKSQRLATIGTIRFDKDNNLWIGTTKGLYFYNTATNKFQYFNTNSKNKFSLLSPLVLEIIRDKKDQLWVCSSKGISKVLKQDNKISFINYSTENGLPNDFVYGGTVDENNQLWLSTNKGLSCFNTIKIEFTNYDASDGLGANEFNSGAFYKNNKGELFFGGLGTLISFKPEKLKLNLHLSKVALIGLNQLSNFSYSNKNTLNELRFKPDINDLLFEFASIDFTNPTKNKIAYQISDRGDTWIDLGVKKSINFADLSPGSYLLKVKSANNIGLWNEKQLLVIPFIILPPFYKTFWFYSLLALIVGIIVYILYSYRLRTNINNLMAIEAARADEKDQLRRTAAQDIHDEFGNSLTRISLLADVASKLIPKESLEAREMLNKISESSLNLYNGSKDFVWALNPDNDNFYEVAFRIKDFADDLFHEQNIHFIQNGLTEDFKNIKLNAGYSRQIVLMFKEAISNIAKHAKATEVSLDFGYNKEKVTIQLSDNGVGFDTNKLSGKGNGINNIKHRAQKMGAHISFNTEINKGLTLIFKLKY